MTILHVARGLLCLKSNFLVSTRFCIFAFATQCTCNHQFSVNVTIFNKNMHICTPFVDNKKHNLKTRLSCQHNVGTMCEQCFDSVVLYFCLFVCLFIFELEICSALFDRRVVGGSSLAPTPLLLFVEVQTALPRFARPGRSPSCKKQREVARYEAAQRGVVPSYSLVVFTL